MKNRRFRGDFSYILFFEVLDCAKIRQKRRGDEDHDADGEHDQLFGDKLRVGRVEFIAEERESVRQHFDNDDEKEHSDRRFDECDAYLFDVLIIRTEEHRVEYRERNERKAEERDAGVHTDFVRRDGHMLAQDRERDGDDDLRELEDQHVDKARRDDLFFRHGEHHRIENIVVLAAREAREEDREPDIEKRDEVRIIRDHKHRRECDKHRRSRVHCEREFFF